MEDDDYVRCEEIESILWFRNGLHGCDCVREEEGKPKSPRLPWKNIMKIDSFMQVDLNFINLRFYACAGNYFLQKIKF